VPTAVPTAVPTSSPEASLTLQENDSGFCSVDGNVENDHSGYTGSGYANTTNASDTAVKYSVVVDADGDYSAVVTYANGGSSARDGVFNINGNNTETVNLGATGGWGNYDDSSAVTLQLTAGYNEVNLVATGSSGLANIDKLELTGYGIAQGDCSGAVTPTAEPTPVPTAEPTPVPTAVPTAVPTVEPTSAPVGTFTIQEGDNGFCGVDGGIDSNNSGYTGSGFANTDNASGKSVNWAITGDAGTYTIRWRFANGASDNRSGVLSSNGSSVSTEDFTGTGSWSSWNTTSVNLNLAGGYKNLSLVANQDSGLGNIDYIEVTGPNAAAASCGGIVPTAEPTVEPTSTPTAEPTAQPTSPPISGDDCEVLVNDPNVNWRETGLQSDQQIIQCLSESLGTPVGYGENATGGYNANGGSKLVIITDDFPEQQILDAISSTDHTWVVFDKDDFRNEKAISMHATYCDDSSVQSALGMSAAQCRDPIGTCGGSESCLEDFFNGDLNDGDLPIRNHLIDSNTTIDGRGSNAYFLFNGFKLGSDSSGKATYTTDNVILTNLDFRGVGHTEDHGLDPDMIRVTGESHDVWIHQNTFDNTGDAAFDIKVGGYDVTISFNKLLNVKRASLHGSSDSRTINSQITSTMLGNLFVTEDQYFGDSKFNAMRRVPLLRRGTTHLINNVFYGYRKDLMSVRVGGAAVVENNMFLNNVDNSKGDDLGDWVENILADVVSDGGIKVTGTSVYESNSNCEIAGSSASLNYSEGSTPDVNGAYNSASRSTISGNRFSVGSDLRDYVLATAGKGGATPYLSSYSDGDHSVISGAPSSCQ